MTTPHFFHAGWPLLLGAALLVSAGVGAQVYKHVDKDGKVTYSTTPPSKEAKPILLPELTTVPAFKGKPGGDAADNGDKAAREAREDRRRLIEEKIVFEEKSLEELRRTYNKGEPERQGDEKNYQKYLDRVERLKHEIEAQEKKIDALRKDLENVQTNRNEASEPASKPVRRDKSKE